MSHKKEEWDGVVFHSSLPGGKGGCKIRIEGLDLVGQTLKGESFRIHIPQLKLEFGGTGKSLLLLKPRDKKDEPIFSIRDRSILSSLKEIALPSTPLYEEITKVQSQKRKHLFWMTTSLGVFVAMVIIFFILFFTYGVEWGTSLVPYSVDEKIGELSYDSAIQQITGGATINRNPIINKAVQEMVLRLVNALDKTPFHFEVRVVDSKIPNAFALPGGKIAVLTGILENADSPEEVAGVLAHEISHVTRRHGIRMLVQRVGTMILLAAIFGDSSDLVQAIVNQSSKLISLKFSRNMEREADYYGFKLLIKAKINPRGMIQFFEKIKKIEKKRGITLPSWISTHPLTENRIQNIQKWLKEAGPIQTQPFKLDWEEVKSILKRQKAKKKRLW